LETTSVLEPSTLVAIIVYAILAVGIVKLIRISSGEEQQID
ncbi:MAG TPA: YggT family protein, partial [Patescibacteria group bacterium]|nr:YggT family protein [Patescibacteria group bacterium]